MKKYPLLYELIQTVRYFHT